MENTTVKVTVKDNFNALLALGDVQARPDLVDFINGRLALLEKKGSSKADEAKAKEQKDLQDKIYNVLVEKGSKMTATEVTTIVGGTNQKISSMLTKMVGDGRVVRTLEKKVAYFTVA